jgi:hypothetical protein
MFLALLICFLIVGIATDFLSVWMKMQVNQQLPEDQRLSWWSRNYRQVNKLYGTQNPDSILPDLNRGGTVVVIALFAAMIVTSIVAGK